MLQKIKLLLLLFLTLMPFDVLGYSEYIIASGDNVGIKIETNGLLVIGTYDIEGEDPASVAGLKVGDRIISINDKNVRHIDDVVNIISNNRGDSIVIGYVRDGIESKTILKLINNKTGLYLKDTISGIGTLTYIDPTTKKFGALGHEIVNSNSGEIVEVADGSIFTSSITSIVPSRDGTPGEKNASLNSKDILGSIEKNTNKGIFGEYNSEIDDNKLYKVATLNDIKVGPAKIKTVLKGNDINEYDINILSIRETDDKTKNIVFEVTDKNLLNETGGIVQGMSGSPIIQGEYIIGAVTHVVVNDTTKGYGIFITNMLEEAEN